MQSVRAGKLRVACISPLRLEICDEIRLGWLFFWSFLACSPQLVMLGLELRAFLLLDKCSQTLFDPVKLKLYSTVQYLPVSYSFQPLTATICLWKLAYFRSLQYIGGNPVFITS